MATQTHPKHAKDHPERTAEARIEAAVEESFPASDPVAHTTAQGSRAVPAEAMLHPAGSRPAGSDDGVTLAFRFPDSESAKLALEAAVREGPVDRRAARIDLDAGQVTMRLDVPRADRNRLDGLLRRHGALES